MDKGITGKMEMTVTEEMTAKRVGSGELFVYATPMLAALVEETAWRSISAELEPGTTTVGTKIELSHISATPPGMKVWCETTLQEIDRRRLAFHFEVFDEAGKIGEGTHERFIVDTEKFMAKANGKLDG